MANRTARRNARAGRVPLLSCYRRLLTHITRNDARSLEESKTARLSETLKRELERQLKDAEDFVERAHNKVEAWHKEYDDRAQSIVAGRVTQPVLVVVHKTQTARKGTQVVRFVRPSA